MSQSTLTAGAIIAAFLLYISAKGTLGTYLGVLGLGGATSSGTVTIGAIDIVPNTLTGSSSGSTGLSHDQPAGQGGSLTGGLQ